MTSLPPGEELEILSRDRFASVEIPLWAARSGHSAPIERRVGVWPLGYRVFTLTAATREAHAN